MKTLKSILGMSVAFLATFASLTGEPSPTETARQTERQIIGCLRAIETAAENGDVDAVFSRVMENDKGAVVQNGEILLTREAARENTRQSFVGIRRLTYTMGQEHLTMLADDVALVVEDGESRVELDDGRIFTRPFAQSVILKRAAGSWMVLHAHRSFPTRN